MTARYCNNEKCGKRVEADDGFCSNCGEEIDEVGPEMRPQPSHVPDEERKRRLSEAVARRTFEGWLVVDSSEQNYSAVLLLPGKPVNHILHALLTIFTCLFWGIVWALLAASQRKEMRMRISIDSRGFLREETLTIQ